eukprot:scaffold151915_cov33-Tisochrysis_lutea.AAC.3
MAVKAERSSQLTSANVGNIELLKSEMLYEGEGDLAKLRAHPALAACTNEFASYLTEAIEEFVATSIEVHGLKSEEREMFTAALDEAKASKPPATPAVLLVIERLSLLSAPWLAPRPQSSDEDIASPITRLRMPQRLRLKLLSTTRSRNACSRKHQRVSHCPRLWCRV